MDYKRLLLVSGALCSGLSAVAQSDSRPNILFILSDDHTSQSWGIYDGILAPYVKNENIKRLAEEGCRMDNVFCTNSISVPSRATILTGQYSHMNGVKTLCGALMPEQDNIAKKLHSAGYQTAIVGKWHLKKEPTGFDFYSVFHDQGDYVNPEFKTADNWIDADKGRSGKREEGFSTDLVTDKVINWIEERDEDRPFMMMCHFKATHEPWDFPERNRHIYDGVVFPEPENMMDFGGVEAGRTVAGQQLENLGWRWQQAGANPDKWWCVYPELPFDTDGMDSVQIRKAIYQKLVRDHLRCGATIDDNIGRLLEYLDKEGLAENTIVVYVADQGYYLGEHGYFDKRIMYEEALRMPFVIRYPKEIPAGSTNDDIVLNTDFASLIADYASTAEPDGAQGRSFRDNLKGDSPKDWRDGMYYRYWTQEKIRPAHFGYRGERYKLIFFYGDKLDSGCSQDYVSTPTWEFYDLKKDPDENTNQYNNKKYARIIKEMKEKMLAEREVVGDTDVDSKRMQEILAEYYW